MSRSSWGSPVGETSPGRAVNPFERPNFTRARSFGARSFGWCRHGLYAPNCNECVGLSGRERLPSLVPLLAVGASEALVGLCHAALLFVPGSTLVNLVFILMMALLLSITRRSYRQKIIERHEVRERNFHRALDWIINTEPPGPSWELAQREKAYELPDQAGDGPPRVPELPL